MLQMMNPDKSFGCKVIRLTVRKILKNSFALPRIIRTVCFLAVGLSLFQCQKDFELIEPKEYSPPTNMSKIVTLKIGNMWIYRRISWNIGGADTTIDTAQVIDTLRWGERKLFRINATAPDPLDMAELGNYLESLDSSDFSMYFYPTYWARGHILTTPLVRGRQFNCADSLNSYEGLYLGTMTIISTDTTIEVSTYKYHHAIYLENYSEVGGGTIVIVPGVGIVLEAIGEIDSGSRIELLKAIIK
jgi:hypothetical protein